MNFNVWYRSTHYVQKYLNISSFFFQNLACYGQKKIQTIVIELVGVGSNKQGSLDLPGYAQKMWLFLLLTVVYL